VSSSPLPSLRADAPTIVDADDYDAAARDPRGDAFIAEAKAFNERLRREGRDHSRLARMPAQDQKRC
jgi:hypothetical protein